MSIDDPHLCIGDLSRAVWNVILCHTSRRKSIRGVIIINVVITEPQFLLVTAEWVKECVLNGVPRHDEARRRGMWLRATPAHFASQG